MINLFNLKTEFIIRSIHNFFYILTRFNYFPLKFTHQDGRLS